jgi:hypothetical protein
MSDEKWKTAEAVRALVLEHNAAHQIRGVNGYAMNAVRSRTMPELLRQIAGNGPQTPQERAFLNALLRAIAEGRDARDELRIDPMKLGHKPAEKELKAYIVSELRERGAGREVTGKDFADVGRLTGKSGDAVRKIWERAQR